MLVTSGVVVYHYQQILIPGLDVGCDEGFTPGNADIMPKVDPYTVTAFLLSNEYDENQVREIWRQPRQQINDSIGYVQVQRDDPICVVKCVVATKVSENHCKISYNEVDNSMLTVSCDCDDLQCVHGITALIWLCTQKPPGTYWMKPIITLGAKSMTLSAIFGFQKIIYENENTVLEEFVKRCQENKDFTPALMKYYQEGEIISASLHNLMAKFKKKGNAVDVESFLYFCQENIKLDCLSDLQNLTPEAKQELICGRITDSILHEVSRATDENVDALIEKITFPNIEENVEVNAALMETLEKSLDMKITKCGLIISTASPIFAIFPYGITDSHVIYVKFLKNEPFNGNKLDPKDSAFIQLQMYVTNKQNACFCAVHESNRMDIVIVKYNQKLMHALLKKAAKFWQTHIFKCIAME